MVIAWSSHGHRSGLVLGPDLDGTAGRVLNKIKLKHRQAYGDLDLFKLRILSLHTTRFELVG